MQANAARESRIYRAKHKPTTRFAIIRQRSLSALQMKEWVHAGGSRDQRLRLQCRNRLEVLTDVHPSRKYRSSPGGIAAVIGCDRDQRNPSSAS